MKATPLEPENEPRLDTSWGPGLSKRATTVAAWLILLVGVGAYVHATSRHPMFRLGLGALRFSNLEQVRLFGALSRTGGLIALAGPLALALVSLWKRLPPWLLALSLLLALFAPLVLAVGAFMLR